jgi:hypothetical protein
MEIYVALRDSDQPQSFIIGAFSREDWAQDACQVDANNVAQGWNIPFTQPLAWENAEATANSGDHYAIVLVDLDRPV